MKNERKQAHLQTADNAPSNDGLSTANDKIDYGHNPDDLPVPPPNDNSKAGCTQMDGAVEEESPQDSEAPDIGCMVEVRSLARAEGKGPVEGRKGGDDVVARRWIDWSQGAEDRRHVL